MKIKWTRGNHSISYTRPDIWFALGKRGGAKSSFLEYTGCNYLDHGAAICDLFGSRDGEGLAWLRSPYAETRKILLVKGENVDVDCSFHVKKADDLTLTDFRSYDIVISSSPLYASVDQEFVYAAKITDLLYTRFDADRLIYVICREAANFYYSRLRVSENQTFAKANMVYLLRESRHMWLALGLDSIRFYAIDIDVRSLSDFMIIKSQGLSGLPKDLQWLYAYVDPHAIRQLKPSEFVLLAQDGSIGFGVFPEIPWHKQEKENMLKAVGISVERGEAPQTGVDKGAFKTVGDREHTEMIVAYARENIGQQKIADRLGRSSRTVQVQIDKHNLGVKKAGFCPACKRANSSYSHSVVVKGQDA